MPGDPYYHSMEWRNLKRKVLKVQNWTCQDCGVMCRGKRLNESTPIVDHITPRKDGGSNSLDNLRILCFSCHNKKTKYEDYNDKEPIGIDGFPASWR